MVSTHGGRRRERRLRRTRKPPARPRASAALDHGIADERITRNVAARVKAPRRRSVHEPRALTVEQLRGLASALPERDGDLVLFLGLTGLRWSEVVGLRVSDMVEVPGLGVRVQRATTSLGGGGRLGTDTVKNNRARTVPGVAELRPVVDRAIGRLARDGLLFGSPEGDQLRLSNWRRDSGWSRVTTAYGLAPLRIHDLRHTAASVWIAARRREGCPAGARARDGEHDRGPIRTLAGQEPVGHRRPSRWGPRGQDGASESPRPGPATSDGVADSL